MEALPEIAGAGRRLWMQISQAVALARDICSAKGLRPSADAGKLRTRGPRHSGFDLATPQEESLSGGAAARSHRDFFFGNGHLRELAELQVALGAARRSARRERAATAHLPLGGPLAPL